ncbi:MAG: endonuclease/exonuclease/phosphatase family protein [Cytophagaceae bacterium]
MKKKLPLITLFICIFSLTVILIQRYFLPSHWIFGFMYLSIPVILIVNILLVILKLWYRPIHVIYPLVVLIFSYSQFKETYGFGSPRIKSKNTFSVSSYNVGTFNYYRWHQIEDTLATIESINWISSNISSDILCIQEFYNNDALVAESTLDEIRESEYPYYYTNPIKKSSHQGFFGIITFSKFPILKGGAVFFGDSSLNRGVFIDVLINSDTVRILNIHMKSMSIRIDSSTSIKNPSSIINNTYSIAEKLKNGFEERNKEVQTIGEFIDASPHKLIVCGDFNDTPYSYTYQFIKRKLTNSFEETGKGFGFTYNKFPYFIRIDQQFYSKGIQAESFKVVNNNKYSDHLPIEGRYSFTKIKQ